MRGRYATNVLVESKVGAGGRIAATFVKRAPPDGPAILQIASSVMTLYPHVYKSIPYDPLRPLDRHREIDRLHHHGVGLSARWPRVRATRGIAGASGVESPA
jgi:hypothetical protein